MSARAARRRKPVPARKPIPERDVPRESPAPSTAARWLPVALVAVATVIAYLPTFANGFVDFDDQTNLTDNPFYRGLGPAQLRWMFTNLEGHYLPLTWLSFGVDYQLWGMNPVGYHLTNLVLHVATTIAFYALAARLLALVFELPDRARPPSLYVAAAVAAALFALHPLRVESVAWATERRDVLSGLFFVLAVNAYVAFHQGRREGIAWTALAWYVPSLLAKPVGMSLPLVLAVLDVYPLRRLPPKLREWTAAAYRVVWKEKAVFVALGIVTAVVEGIAERNVDTFYSLAQYPVSGRIGQAFFALAFYVRKTLLPVGLSPLYQLPVGWRFLRTDVLVSAAFVVVVTVVVIAVRRTRPWALAAWLVYAALLAPVLGIAQAGPHIAADRYSYLATLVWALVGGGAVLACDVAARAGRARVPFSMVVTASGAVALVLATLTWRQVGVWHDSITLWRVAIAVDPQCYICLDNLGTALIRAGRASDAAPHFAAALAVQPNDADAHANLGTAALQAGRTDEARRELEAALRIDPNHAVAHTNLGQLLIDAGDTEHAIPHLEAALRRDPSSAEAHTNLGLALLARDDVKAAERELRQAVMLQPELASAENNLGILLLRTGDNEAAATAFRRAAALDAAFPEARYNLGLALAALGRTDDAIAALRAALQLRPAYPKAQQKLVELLLATGHDDEAHALASAADGGDASAALALSYIEAGRTGDAIRVLRTIVAKDESDADATSMLAWLLATARDDALRDGKAAVALAERAVAQAGDDVDADRLDTLAAAYAEVGRYADALVTARRAVDKAGASDLAGEIRERIALYERGQPYRE